nr:hypothetical protein MmNV_66 [Menippe mercenaria nudivirus]
MISDIEILGFLQTLDVANPIMFGENTHNVRILNLTSFYWMNALLPDNFTKHPKNIAVLNELGVNQTSLETFILYCVMNIDSILKTITHSNMNRWYIPLTRNTIKLNEHQHANMILFNKTLSAEHTPKVEFNSNISILNNTLPITKNRNALIMADIYDICPLETYYPEDNELYPIQRALLYNVLMKFNIDFNKSTPMVELIHTFVNNLKTHVDTNALKAINKQLILENANPKATRAWFSINTTYSKISKVIPAMHHNVMTMFEDSIIPRLLSNTDVENVEKYTQIDCKTIRHCNNVITNATIMKVLEQYSSFVKNKSTSVKSLELCPIEVGYIIRLFPFYNNNIITISSDGNIIASQIRGGNEESEPPSVQFDTIIEEEEEEENDNNNDEIVTRSVRDPEYIARLHDYMDDIVSTTTTTTNTTFPNYFIPTSKKNEYIPPTPRPNRKRKIEHMNTTAMQQDVTQTLKHMAHLKQFCTFDGNYDKFRSIISNFDFEYEDLAVYIDQLYINPSFTCACIIAEVVRQHTNFDIDSIGRYKLISKLTLREQNMLSTSSCKMNHTKTHQISSNLIRVLSKSLQTPTLAYESLKNALADMQKLNNITDKIQYASTTNMNCLSLLSYLKLHPHNVTDIKYLLLFSSAPTTLKDIIYYECPRNLPLNNRAVDNSIKYATPVMVYDKNDLLQMLTSNKAYYDCKLLLDHYKTTRDSELLNVVKNNEVNQGIYQAAN